MEQYIKKSALVAEIESRKKYAQTLGDNAINGSMQQFYDGMKQGCVDILSFIDTLEVKEVDLMIHTIIAECCDWLAMNTNLSHDKIEGCRNLMLTVKDEQLKAQKGEEV